MDWKLKALKPRKRLETFHLRPRIYIYTHTRDKICHRIPSIHCCVPSFIQLYKLRQSGGNARRVVAARRKNSRSLRLFAISVSVVRITISRHVRKVRTSESTPPSTNFNQPCAIPFRRSKPISLKVHPRRRTLAANETMHACALSVNRCRRIYCYEWKNVPFSLWFFQRGIFWNNLKVGLNNFSKILSFFKIQGFSKGKMTEYINIHLFVNQALDSILLNFVFVNLNRCSFFGLVKKQKIRFHFER